MRHDGSSKSISRRSFTRSLLALPVGIAAAAAARSTLGDETRKAPDIRDFRPSVHGFAFVNNFRGSPLAIGGLEVTFGAPDEYGLCGGMSFAAADLYIAGIAPPTNTTPPKRPAAQYNWLHQRQRDSLGDGFAQAKRFSHWMSIPDNGPAGTRDRTLGTLSEILARLNAGKPVVLGLVLNRRMPGAAIWENHQVLAYRAVTVNQSTTDIMIYDPNHPRDDAAKIRCRLVIVGEELGLPVLGVESVATFSKGRPLPIRGIFVMPYQPAPVPERR